MDLFDITVGEYLNSLLDATLWKTIVAISIGVTLGGFMGQMGKSVGRTIVKRCSKQ